MKIQFVLKGLRAAGIEFKTTEFKTTEKKLYSVKTKNVCFYISEGINGNVKKIERIITYEDGQTKTAERIISRKALLSAIQEQVKFEEDREQNEAESIHECNQTEEIKINNVETSTYDTFKGILINYCMSMHKSKLKRGKWFTGDSLSLDKGQEIKFDEEIIPHGAWRTSKIGDIFKELVNNLYFPIEDYSFDSEETCNKIVNAFNSCTKEEQKNALEEARKACVDAIEVKKARVQNTERVVCRLGDRLYVS